MQLEPIIAAKLKTFQDYFELENLTPGVAFGRFVNHSIISSRQPDAFTADSELLEKMCVDGSGDTGIDGIAILLNGLVIKDKSDIDSIMNQFKFVNVEFVFIQSKYSIGFDSAGFLKFISGVRDFLNVEQKMPQNDKIKDAQELKKYILSDHFIAKWENNPFVKLYYVAMGRWSGTPHLTALIEQAKEDIYSLDTYEKPDIYIIDSEALKSICDSNENKFDVTIAAYDIMELTPVEGVENSCIAVVYCSELIKMLQNPNGDIRKSLFDDNVRDYQGENVVNKEIFQTIKDEPSKFILLNNGITVVCDDFKTSTKRITIKNPQVVNGCQTCHVLFNAYKLGHQLLKVPINIKVISTKDINISNQIVRGTNRQSQVLEEAFETTKPFHQKLEEFFNAYSTDPFRIYYERRSKQYKHLHTIKNAQIINLQVLIHSFVGMMLDKPDQVQNSLLTMLKQFKNDIFLDKQSFLPYYTSALAFNQLEKLFRDFTISKELRSFKPHLLMMFREVVGGSLPPINDNKLIDEHCKKILLVNKDQVLTKEIYIKLADIFKEARKIWVTQMGKSKYGMKDVPEFTKVLKNLIRKEYSIKPSNYDKIEKIIDSEVILTRRDIYGLWFGFISGEPEKIFFHEKQNPGLDFKKLKGKKVEYKIGKTDKNKTYAYNVKIIEE